MAIIQVDNFFVEESIGVFVNYRVYYNDVSFAITSERYTTAGDLITAGDRFTYSGYPNDRMYLEGDKIYQTCSGTTGKIIKATVNAPYGYMVEELNAAYCSNAPVDPACDLANLTATKTIESAEYAGDGKITASATSTKLPVMYRLTKFGQVSGVYGSANNFTALTSGSYFLEAKDAANCTVSTVVTLESARQILIETPVRNLSAGNASRWSAVFNPAIFKYQRKDFSVELITIFDEFRIKVHLSSVRWIASADIPVVAKKKCYVKTKLYSFSMIPESISADGSSLIFNMEGIMTVIADPSQGLMNTMALRVGHRFVTEIKFGFDDVKQVVTARHSADNKGIAIADVSKYLKSALSAADTYKYDATNYRDPGLSASYTVRYREEWDGGAGEWKIIAEPFYVTYSALQLGNTYGSNMAAYVPFAVESDPLKLAKFLNEYTQPEFVSGLPFDLAFIYSEKLAGREVRMKETPLDINGQPIAGFSSAVSFLLNEDASFLLNEDASRLVIQRAGNETIVKRVGVNRLKMNTLLPAVAKVAVYLYYMDGVQEVRITEIKILRVSQKPDCKNYKYLKWIGPKGGWNYALFDFKAEHSLDIGEVQSVERFIEDYATQDTSEDVISKSATRKVTVGKNGVSANELEALSTMLYSPKVYVLTSENPITWHTVVIESKGGKLYDTVYDRGDFEITYRLPALNTQKQ